MRAALVVAVGLSLLAAPASAQQTDGLAGLLDTLAVLWSRGDAAALVAHGAEAGLDLEIHGESIGTLHGRRAGHAAFADQGKSSAILEMAHKIIQFESLNDFQQGITVNVGKVEGGIGPNTVSEFCTAQIDFRYVAPEDFKYIESRILNIIRLIVCSTNIF